MAGSNDTITGITDTSTVSAWTYTVPTTNPTWNGV